MTLLLLGLLDLTDLLTDILLASTQAKISVVSLGLRLPKPLQRLCTVFWTSVTEQPEWRLGNPPEEEQLEQVEKGRNYGDQPPVEESPQAVGGQYPQTNHQGKQSQDPSSPLNRTAGGEF